MNVGSISRFASALAIALVSARAVAQTAPPASTSSAPPAGVLTLREALQSAQRNVPSVLSALAQVRVAEGQAAMAHTALEPFVTGTATGQASASNTDLVSGGTLICGGATGCIRGPLANALVDGTVSARWTFWDFGRTALNVEAARLTARGAMSDVRSAERLAMSAAGTAYYAVLADQQAIAAAEETLRQRERELDIARARVSAGTDPPINQTRAEISEQTAVLDLSRARAAALNDLAGLAAALALDPAHPPAVVQPPDLVVDDDPDRAANTAIAARPEIQSARLRISSLESSVAAARAGWRPSLSANGSAGARYTESSLGSGSVSESANASVVLTVPIYDPTIAANVRIAEGQLAAARAVLASQILQARTDAVQAAIAVRTAREQLAQAERNAALAAANLQMAEGRYAAGTAQLLELVDAQAQDVTARVAVIQQRFQLERAEIALLAATNQLPALAR